MNLEKFLKEQMAKLYEISRKTYKVGMKDIRKQEEEAEEMRQVQKVGENK